MSAATYVEGSKNHKISGEEKVDATYSAIANTCPSTCSLKNKGCYAQSSYAGMTNTRLETAAGDKGALDSARDEAKAIDHSYSGKAIPGRNLRLHVSGDSRTIKGTRLLASAIKRWKSRGGASAWSYTHAWKAVKRSNWGQVSILASLDSIKDVAAARLQGYAPAVVVKQFDGPRAFMMEGTKFIPCPAQTKEKVTCSSCKLCWKADWLFANNIGIAFAAHGAKKRTLPVVQ